MTPQLSVVVPAYNEEKMIGASLARLLAYLEPRGDSELIIVDDGSTDQTARIVQDTAADHPILRLVRNGGNRGKGYAIKHGVLVSRGEFMLYTDADLVYPLEGIEPFLQALRSGADVAIGSRSHASTLFALHPRHFSYIYRRYLVGRAYIRTVRRVLGLRVSDTQCGFKCFRGQVARDVFSRTRLHDFAFDVEAIFVATKLGYRVVELPVYFLYLGEQSTVQLVKDSVQMLRDLLAIRWNSWRGLYASQSIPEGLPAVGEPAPPT